MGFWKRLLLCHHRSVARRTIQMETVNCGGCGEIVHGAVILSAEDQAKLAKLLKDLADYPTGLGWESLDREALPLIPVVHRLRLADDVGSKDVDALKINKRGREWLAKSGMGTSPATR